MAKRKLRQALVVVCEGEKTEPCYIKEIIEYARSKGCFNYDDYKILPSKDNDQPIQQRSSSRPKQSFKGNKDGICGYTELTEIDSATYEKYKAHPLRFVREAALFLENEAYTKAWVVFDKDEHPAHEKAFMYAKETGVSIAFSSRSIEEWFLCHFERNSQPFDKTMCDICANEASETFCDNSCLIGRLRKKFMSDYIKKKDDVFTKYTIKNIRKAFINASWTRFYSSPNKPSKHIWECNPYTDIDKMIQDLFSTDLLNKLEISGSFEWFKLDQTVSNTFCLKLQAPGQYLIKNCSDRTIVIEVSCLKDDLSDKQHLDKLTIERGLNQSIKISTDRPIIELCHRDKYYYHTTQPAE